jgi:hypothetical protein
MDDADITDMPGLTGNGNSNDVTSEGNGPTPPGGFWIVIVPAGCVSSGDQRAAINLFGVT